ncbi:unnamed protein product [Trichogramma brassicae]|uniref:Uncharacterized protein n=1 Tax=Trichogramma brassicae TaxID=86971 RepID=A0A6H5I485_9HYME|nr:unnamed protein product [Trichogramma brassicae]
MKISSCMCTSMINRSRGGASRRSGSANDRGSGCRWRRFSGIEHDCGLRGSELSCLLTRSSRAPSPLSTIERRLPLQSGLELLDHTSTLFN